MDDEIERLLAEARYFVEEGFLILADDKLKEVYEQNNANIKIKVDNVKQLYPTGLENMLKKIEKYAEQGEILSMEMSFGIIKDFVSNSDKKYNEKIKKIFKLGYTKGLPISLENAKNYAESGDVELMKSNLGTALKCASELGLEIPEADDIRKKAYNNRMQTLLKLARAYAKKGKINNLKIQLDYINKFTNNTGFHPPKDEIKKLKELAGVY